MAVHQENYGLTSLQQAHTFLHQPLVFLLPTNSISFSSSLAVLLVASCLLNPPTGKKKETTNMPMQKSKWYKIQVQSINNKKKESIKKNTLNHRHDQYCLCGSTYGIHRPLDQVEARFQIVVSTSWSQLLLYQSHCIAIVYNFSNHNCNKKTMGDGNPSGRTFSRRQQAFFCVKKITLTKTPSFRSKPGPLLTVKY